MARTYQVACPPGSLGTIADLTTLGGGASVIVLNSHATEPLYIGGDENELQSGGGSALTVATGIRIAAGKSLTVTLNGGERLYGRSGTSTVTISAMVFRANFKNGSTGLT